MGIVIFDPSCFVDEVYTGFTDPRHPENKLIALDTLSKIRLYQEVLQSLVTPQDILARAVDANSYVSTDDDLYTAVDILCDNLVKILDFEHVLCIGEEATSMQSLDEVVDEYEAFFQESYAQESYAQCGGEYGEEFEDDDDTLANTIEATVFSDCDEAIEILRNLLTSALEYSIINYTGKRNLVSKSKIL